MKPQVDALSEDQALAAQALDSGIKLLGENPPRLSDASRKILAYIAGKAKQTDRLVRIDRLAVKNAPTPQNYQELFFDLFRADRHDEAEAAMDEYLAKFPVERTSRTVLLLSKNRYFGGKIESSLEAAREAQKLDPGDRDVLEFLGYVLSKVGKDDDAIALYEDMLRRFANDEDAVKKARSGLSTAFVNKGNFARGEAELEILLQKFPEDPGVNNDLGYLYADQGKNLERAEIMIRKAVEEEPENAAYLDSLGWVLFKRGKMKEAVEPLEKAAKSERVDTTICEHLGDVLFRLQEYGRAKEFWTRAEGYATKAQPPDKRLAEIKKKLADLEKLGPTRSDAAKGPADRP